MANYLGETPVVISESKFKDYTPADWVMYHVARYGQIDGSRHKQWVLDQIARILKGSPIIVKLARWENGHEEYRVDVGDPSPEYEAWVLAMKGKYHEEDDEYDYDYDPGSPP